MILNVSLFPSNPLVLDLNRRFLYTEYSEDKWWLLSNSTGHTANYKRLVNPPTTKKLTDHTTHYISFIVLFCHQYHQNSLQSMFYVEQKHELLLNRSVMTVLLFGSSLPKHAMFSNMKVRNRFLQPSKEICLMPMSHVV